jgi:hypothetical protein
MRTHRIHVWRPGVVVALALIAASGPHREICILQVPASGGEPAKGDSPKRTKEASFEQEIIDSVKRIGGKARPYTRLAEGSRVWQLDFSRTEVAAKEIAAVIAAIETKKAGISSVSVRKTEIGDEIVEILDHCKPNYWLNGEPINFSGGLSGLDLSHTRLTTKGMKQIIKVHRNLTVLDLSALPVDAKSLADIRGIWGLRTLVLRNTPLDDAAGIKLAETHLDKLDVGDSSVSDEFVRALSNVPKQENRNYELTTSLDELDLSGTRVTDKALAHIRSFSFLRRLDLSRTSISDESEVKVLIRSLKYLKRINLSETRLSAESALRLTESCPGVSIGHGKEPGN